MTVAIAAFKGGVSKTTTAVHLAGFLAQGGNTVLVDADPNHSALAWSARGPGLPFTVLDERAASKRVNEFTHKIIDTEARPSKDDLLELADGCDLLVLPTTPDAMSLDALMISLEGLRGNYRVLVTVCPPSPSRAGVDARDELRGAGWPVFKTCVRRFAAYQKAAAQGVLVRSVRDPKALTAWSDYEEFGKEVIRGNRKI